MDLLEHQGKRLLARHGLPVSPGRLASDVAGAVAAAEQLGYPCAVKAQVPTGGRGKAGGIRLASDREQARAHAEAILGMSIGGHAVQSVWVEAGAQVARELYAAVLLDRGARSPMAILSARGGIDIEELAASEPGAIARLHVDPLLGLQDFHGRLLAVRAGAPRELLGPLASVLRGLYRVFASEEATLVEVNPLAVTADGSLLALDAKVTLDDNAAFRHPDHAELRAQLPRDPQEAMAAERGLTYVKLDGEVGILGNGAGLVMATLDLVAQVGGRPANFLDAGGGSKADAIEAAVEVILSDEKVRAVLFNIFGGITRCDEVARGLIEAHRRLRPRVPFVVRLDGTNDREGRELLRAAGLEGMHVEETMEAAARRAVALAGAQASARLKAVLL
ncbi:MAG TPA: ADP-forming succinate--CoA ligase subunit beta [Solirubrobacteraceae bacterium]|nr:ADP-forming succinate--CoA ligase subunit beta [Solirubrobacteraceae bacterium]